jgi:hypothetical protein
MTWRVRIRPLHHERVTANCALRGGELCLTVPARLSALEPLLPRLLPVLAAALRAPAGEVGRDDDVAQ